LRQTMKNQFLAGAICLCLAHCAVDTTGVTTTGSMPSSSSTGGDEQPIGDAFPEGTVAYFRKVACPDGWEFYPDAHGRTIIAASEGLPRGTLIGEPLTKGEDRVHVHSLNTMVDVEQTEIAGIEGGGNDGMTPAGAYSFATISGPALSGVPYIRFLTCKKRETPAATALALPPKLHMYFDLDVCPSGWKPAIAADGRLVVGRPKDAPADLPFGGDPITTSEPRTHTHTFESTLTTNPHGVALISGCCGKFGKNGTFPVAGQTEPASVDFPMISLLHCEKE
jgi:hypothetical protein